MALFDPFLWLAKKCGYIPPVTITHWQENVIKFACTKVLEGQVVLLGDSITEGWNSTEHMKNCINYGIAGDMTDGTVKFIEHVVRIKPKRVIINIGTNDIGFFKPIEETFTNYRIIIDKLSDVVPNSEIVFCAIRPINCFFGGVKTRNNLVIINYNKKLEKLCEEKDCTFEPNTYNVHLMKINGSDYLTPDNTFDGLHLNVKGYNEEYEVLKKYL